MVLSRVELLGLVLIFNSLNCQHAHKTPYLLVQIAVDLLLPLADVLEDLRKLVALGFERRLRTRNEFLDFVDVHLRAVDVVTPLALAFLLACFEAWEGLLALDLPLFLVNSGMLDLSGELILVIPSRMRKAMSNNRRM